MDGLFNILNHFLVIFKFYSSYHSKYPMSNLHQFKSLFYLKLLLRCLIQSLYVLDPFWSATLEYFNFLFLCLYYVSSLYFLHVFTALLSRASMSLLLTYLPFSTKSNLPDSANRRGGRLEPASELPFWFKHLHSYSKWNQQTPLSPNSILAHHQM